MKVKYLAHQHTHIIVNDIDFAAEFYNTVMGLLEMQSHDSIVNKGMAAYYGIEDYENFKVSMRFMSLPGILTIKLLKVNYKYHGSDKVYSTEEYTSNDYSTGIGPISVAVENLDESYDYFVNYARNYSNRFKIKLLSPPVFLSPILPHEIGATQNSILYGQKEILADIAETFPQRAKFQLIDPFNVRWEFNNNII